MRNIFHYVYTKDRKEDLWIGTNPAVKANISLISGIFSILLVQWLMFSPLDVFHSFYRNWNGIICDSLGLCIINLHKIEVGGKQYSFPNNLINPMLWLHKYLPRCCETLHCLHSEELFVIFSVHHIWDKSMSAARNMNEHDALHRTSLTKIIFNIGKKRSFWSNEPCEPWTCYMATSFS